MEKRINWLHFTDLHYGLSGQNILLPKIKKELFRDIEYIKEAIGKIDIVFFTGDLSQSGKKEEFDELTVLLKDLWTHFGKLNSEPLLVAIPGNHDLTRPDPSRAVVKLLRKYHADNELQADLWNDLLKANSENAQLINQCFENFTNWYKSIDIPKPELNYGLVPGDISSDINIGNVRLKIVGLNTAFLELAGDDYLGKLAIHPSQLMALTGDDPFSWVENADMSLLLTHHDPKWYDSSSSLYYNNDINPGGTFYSHLCGHLHEANTFNSGMIGADSRRIQLGPSLFGLQKINGKVDRIHGYFAGSYIFQNNGIKELFYPRKATLKYDQNYGIDADTGFHLNKGGYIELNRQLKDLDIKPFSQTITTVADAVFQESVQEKPSTITGENILELKNDYSNSIELEKIPKANYLPLQQHAQIRLVEQHAFVYLMKADRLAWLITDWGLNEAEFIASVYDQLDLGKNKNGFILNCEDIASDKELLTSINEQFGMTLQRFCNFVSHLSNTLLVFDHVNVSLFSGSQQYGRFFEILTSILDYCPNIYIVVVARQAPVNLGIGKFIRLAPLDAAQIRSYVENHPGSTIELKSTENLRRLIEITSGLPKHIDRVIDSLKVATFEELIEAERESFSESFETHNIPKSLRQAISTLTDTTDRMRLRSLKLLKILTVLANGETLKNLNRFDATEPIYVDNATELERLSLLEAITSSKTFTKVSEAGTQQIKILRAPRQIRDYMNTLITDNERENILKLACDMYFGSKWRQGNIKEFYRGSLFGANKFFNIDNCHLIINNLMATAIKSGNQNEIERASLVAINFCEHVFDIGDYKNVINTAEYIYNWLKSTDQQRNKATISKLLGEALRMTGNHEKSNIILLEALSMEGGQLSNDEKNSIRIDLGYTYLKQNKREKAIECAKAIEKTTTPKSAHDIQARYILAEANLDGDELLKRLRSLENEARREGIPNLQNTISLNIAEKNQDMEDREKRFNKVLSSKEDDYNKVRAIVSKSIDGLEAGKSITNEDLLLLNLSYSYLYTQQLASLFNRCHVALWLFCIKEQRKQDLLNLFKHSSLVWRISGENDLERSYFEKLEKAIGASLQDIPRDVFNAANIDYFNRRKLELSVQGFLLETLRNVN